MGAPGEFKSGARGLCEVSAMAITAKRVAANDAVAGTVADGDGQFGPGAEERDVPDTYVQNSDDCAFSAGRVFGAGVFADA